MRKSHKFFTLLLFFWVTRVFPVVGWYDKIAIDSRISDYSYARGESLNAIYLVTAGLTSAFVKGSSAEYEIKLHVFKGGRPETFKVQRVKMAASETLFPVQPTIAVNGNEIMVAWQETMPEGNAAGIYYLYSSDGPAGFQPKQVLPVSQNNATAILPQAMADASGQFYIFFQESTGANRFTLKASTGRGGTFNNNVTVVRDLQNLGRGVFFPSVVFRGQRVDLFYQNRNEQNLKDDIFLISSQNQGGAWGAPQRLTQNDFHDFSPQGIAGPEGLEWVWQSNEDKIWNINTAGEKRETQKVTSSATNSYLPVMAYSETAGRIFAWYDYKVSPPQVFAIFADGEGNSTVSQAHQVTKEGGAATNPQLITWGKNTFLSYLSSGRLFLRQADTRAEVPAVTLKNHKGANRVGGSAFTANWKISYEPSGVDQIAYLINNKPDAEPSIYNLNAQARQVSATGLKGGKYYFHLRYRDKAGNESDVSHTEFTVDEGIPSPPLIESDTHKENTDTPLADARFRLTADDDSGIAYYRYALAQSAVTKLEQKSINGEVSFQTLSDGDYVLSAQAVDNAGRTSEISAYTFGVGAPDQNTLQMSHNAVGNVLNSRDLTFTLSDSSGRVPARFFYHAGKVAANPYLGKRSIALANSEGFFVANLQLQPEKVHVISAGVEYADGKRSKPRHFFFSRPGAQEMKLQSVGPVPIKAAATVSSGRGVKAAIAMNQKDSVFSFSFSLRGVNPRNVKGYIWDIAEKPYEPAGEINSSGGPEYIYMLPPGKYFLNLGAVYLNNGKEQIFYEQKEFLVERKIPVKVFIFAATLFFSGVVAAVMLVFYRKKIYYFWSKYQNDRANS